MVIIKNQNLFEIAHEGEAICIPTNGIVNKHGELVMGNLKNKTAEEIEKSLNVALQTKAKFPGIEVVFGKHVRTNGNIPKATKHESAPYWMISFPTKNDWRKMALLPLIEESCKALVEMVDAEGWTKVYLPPVGCGLGKLSWTFQVKPLLEEYLDDRFVVILNDEMTRVILDKWPSKKDTSERAELIAHYKTMGVLNYTSLNEVNAIKERDCLPQVSIFDHNIALVTDFNTDTVIFDVTKYYKATWDTIYLALKKGKHVIVNVHTRTGSLDVFDFGFMGDALDDEGNVVDRHSINYLIEASDYMHGFNSKSLMDRDAKKVPKAISELEALKGYFTYVSKVDTSEVKRWLATAEECNVKLPMTKSIIGRDVIDFDAIARFLDFKGYEHDLVAGSNELTKMLEYYIVCNYNIMNNIPAMDEDTESVERLVRCPECGYATHSTSVDKYGVLYCRHCGIQLDVDATLSSYGFEIGKASIDGTQTKGLGISHDDDYDGEAGDYESYIADDTNIIESYYESFIEDEE